MSDALDVDPLERPVGGEQVAVVEAREQREAHICRYTVKVKDFAVLHLNIRLANTYLVYNVKK
jgi:hypothetical protein